jgi:hypothetical protein
MRAIAAAEGRHVRARSIPIAFGLEKTLLIQLEVEGATLLSRFVCARESSAAPRERFFVRAALIGHSPPAARAAHQKRERQSATCIRLACGATAMQIISTHSHSLTRRDCARGERPIKRFYCSARSVCLWPLVSIVCLPLGDKTRDRREPCMQRLLLCVCVCLRPPNHR